MVSLWGSGKDGDDRDDGPQPAAGGDASRSSEPRQSVEEPDERTRLIPPRGGFLSPDDPAVSPYNLWSVRVTSYLSVLFLAITFLWWTLLFISIFISPPGMHSRGSGFFDVSYATLTIGNLLVAVLFFSIPSTPMGILDLVLAVLLLIDMIIILAVPGIRSAEGWVGITSVIWATVMSLWAVTTNKTVRWGKKEEEQRLTGREETKRSLREWCGVVTATIIMVVLVAVAVLLTATLTLRAVDAGLAPPGKKYYVDGNKYEVHVACFGNHSKALSGTPNPTVLVESGEEATEGSGLGDFIADAYSNGTIGRYCIWDRPGLAWSDNAPSPHSAGMSATVLSEALALAGEDGPWLLVSAGIGSLTSRIFSWQAKEVQGLMLIDGLHEDLLYRVGAPSRGFFLWAWGLISPLGLDRVPGAIFNGRSSADRVYGRAAYQGGKYIKSKLQENLVADSLTRNEVLSARNIQAPNTPLVVVSSGIQCKRDRVWGDKQKDLTTITGKLLAWDTVKGAPHEVWKTLEGRTVLEKRLGQLYGGGRKSNWTRAEQ